MRDKLTFHILDNIREFPEDQQFGALKCALVFGMNVVNLNTQLIARMLDDLNNGKEYDETMYKFYPRS